MSKRTMRCPHKDKVSDCTECMAILNPKDTPDLEEQKLREMVDADGLKTSCMYCPYCDYKPSGECQNPYKECSACAGIRSALNALLRELEGKVEAERKHIQFLTGPNAMYNAALNKFKQILADARVGEENV